MCPASRSREHRELARIGSSRGQNNESDRPARAIVTIASGRGIARARVLCNSFKEHEPDTRRFLVVVDKPASVAIGDDEPFEVIWVEDLPIPEIEDFMAQYEAPDARAAVKPYALLHLLEHYSIDQLLYLDPDILVMAPLVEAWAAFDRGSVVLTPHLRDPFRDSEEPSESQILRSGTYNLGFIGLRPGPSAVRLLTWWAERTEYDCSVDPRGEELVDQRWMDLVPSYIGDVVVLRDAGHGVAYWNLHEREITNTAGQLRADGRPLAFYQFSGYEPDRPSILSRHQTRHDLRSMPVLRRLFDTYGERLRAAGHDAAMSSPYGFSMLANGIPISPALRASVRIFRKRGIDYPSVRDADAFCEFALTPNASVCGTEISPFTFCLLEQRIDVAAAYPNARRDAQDPGFLHWLANSAHECESDELWTRFKFAMMRENSFQRICRIYGERPDLRAEYPDAFRTQSGLEAFGAWLVSFGVAEMGVALEEVDVFIQAGKVGFERVVEYYLANPDLHAQFPLALLPCGDAFVDWLIRHATKNASLTVPQILWFRRRLRETDPSALALLTAMRNEWVSLRFPLGATRFGWRELCGWLRAEAVSSGHELPPLATQLPRPIPMLLQLETLHTTGPYAARYPHALRDREALREFTDAATGSEEHAREQIEQAISAFAPKPGINVAGYFRYAAGIGSSVRSLVRTLDAAGIPHDDLTLPAPPSLMGSSDREPGLPPERFWKQHRPDFDVSITVANPDTVRVARAFLGPGYEHGRRHIGYWVWETDRLPGKYAAAAAGLESIWTPSEFSAAGIRKTLGSTIRVDVVPHSITPGVPNDPRPLPVSLPDGPVLIGFFFDARSVVERKNPADLLRAFRLAFREDDHVALVLKVSHAYSAPRAMRRLEALAEGLPVIWIRDAHLDELQTSMLLNRLDVYASLHRAEGFGLVLAEAMALGKPVIATGFSGNLDFMDNDSARLVRQKEVVTDRAYGPYPRGTRWAEPDVEHAAELLRSLSLDAQLRDEIGQRAKIRIEQTLAPSVVARTVQQLLGWDAGGQIAAMAPDAVPPTEAPIRDDEAAESTPHADTSGVRRAVSGE